MSVSPHDRASATFTTVATAVCCAPEPPRSAKFNSRWDNPALKTKRLCISPKGGQDVGAVWRRQDYKQIAELIEELQEG